MPAPLAKIVSSLPMPTPAPGLKRVPRWRTMISPPVTFWPANTFTPRRFASESRPLRLDPNPFLCAISVFLLFLLGGCLLGAGRPTYFLYVQARQLRAVAHAALVTLLGPVGVDPQLGPAEVLGHDGLDLHLAEIRPVKD